MSNDQPTNDQPTNDQPTARPTMSTLAFVWALIRKKPLAYVGYTVAGVSFRCSI
ncbi:MAG: hypothetical protein H6645_10830 [Caldilineaceae bacterium]|nr:hypothetical protein [Caldilineaceae bacterium]